MDPFRTLRFSQRLSSLLTTFVAFKASKHSVMRVFQELIFLLACRVEGASRTAIQSRFASSKLHFLHLLVGFTIAFNLNPVKI